MFTSVKLGLIATLVGGLGCCQLGLSSKAYAQGCWDPNSKAAQPPSDLEKEQNAPYCRTKAGKGLTTDGKKQANIGLYWPYNKRIVTISPVFSSCKTKCSNASIGEMREALQSAVQQWNTAGDQGCTDIQFVIDTQNATTTYTNRYPDPGWGVKGFDGLNVIVWREKNWAIESSDEGFTPAEQKNLLALTNIRYVADCGVIFDADISVNAEDYTWSVDGAGGTKSIQSVLLHELGHVIGFNHVKSDASVMYYSSSRVRNELTEGDVAGLCEVYPIGRPNLEDCYVHPGNLDGKLGCAVSTDRPEFSLWLSVAIFSFLLRRRKI